MDTTFDFKLLDSLLKSLYEFTPKILGGILFVLIGWLCLKAVLFIVNKSLKLTKIDDFTAKISKGNPLLPSGKEINLSKIILLFVKWFLILVLIVIGAEILKFTMISNEIGKLISYLPKFLSAVLIFVLGVYGASIAKKALENLIRSFDLNGSKAISQIVFYILLIFVSVMALNQAGIDTEVITKNLFLILGAFLAAFSIALGLGSRDIILRLLLGFYSRKNFQIGQRIRIDDKEGIVVSIDNICLVLEANGHKIVYPIKQITNKKIEILEL